MSTLDDLRYLQGVVLSWLETPSVEDFDTSEVLNGADNFQIWFDGDTGRWEFGFGYYWKSEHPDSATFTFDLTRYGVHTHQDAIEFLRMPERDTLLQGIALKYDSEHRGVSAH